MVLRICHWASWGIVTVGEPHSLAEHALRALRQCLKLAFGQLSLVVSIPLVSLWLGGVLSVVLLFARV